MHKTIEIERLDGGLNLKSSPLNLHVDESPELKSVVFDEFGAVETCKGFTRINKTSLSSTNSIQNLISYTSANGVTSLMAVCNGSLYKYNNAPAISLTNLVVSSPSGIAGIVRIAIDDAATLFTIDQRITISNSSKTQLANGTYYVKTIAANYIDIKDNSGEVWDVNRHITTYATCLKPIGWSGGPIDGLIPSDSLDDAYVTGYYANPGVPARFHDGQIVSNILYLNTPTPNGYAANEPEGTNIPQQIEAMVYMETPGTVDLQSDIADFEIVPDSSGVFSYTQPVFSSIFKDKLFLSDGESASYKYDGSTFTKWGVDAPTSGCIAIVSTIDGNPSGTYKYAVLGVNANGAMGNYGPFSTPITVNGKMITVNNIPIFDAITGVTSVYILRNKNDAPDLMYIIGEVVNGVTTFNDNFSDDDLIDEAPTNNGRPESFISHIVLKGVMFGIKKDSSNLYFSNVEEPETWNTNNFLKINNGDGLYCTGLTILADSLIISKNKEGGAGTIYMLYMPDSDHHIDWNLQKIDSWTGGQAPKAMVPFANNVMMLNRFGIWDMNNPSVGSIKPDPISFNIEPMFSNLEQKALKLSTATSWKNKLYVSVPYGSGTLNNNRILIYDYVKGRSDENRFNGQWSYMPEVYINDFTIHENNLYAGDSISGVVYQMDTGYNYNLSPIQSSYKSAPIYGSKGDEGYIKVWRKAWFLVENVGDWNLNVYSYTDLRKDTITDNIITTTVSGVWGSNIWGGSVWGTNNVYTTTTSETINSTHTDILTLQSLPVSGIIADKRWIKLDLTGCVGKYIQFKFATNTANQYFKVNKIKLDYYLKGSTR